ncbi:TIGR01459 family HAD-type hydrolase [Acetobacter conturbans]|uniref:TIGR01459 family HAD-type hydrolase n=1 Tax=Acetobacter conturbans TaxID=1737472 RepID=A0ABX0JYE6_9PROT|nr:TIGR01459 family HAD-type hydrolase [Acetobacter conturbans]
MSTRRIEVLRGVAPLADRYDGFIIDLWGTVHNGVRPFPGAVECLRALKDAGKRIVLLSNAPRPASVIRGQLDAMGVESALYDGVITSGEVTWRVLAGCADPSVASVWPWVETLGKRVFHIGGQHDLALFEGLGVERVSNPADATFVLNTGPDERRGQTELEPYLEPLAACAVRDLPMICANPDMEVIRDGVRLICAGLLAKAYEEKGGVVHWIGKPFPPVYEPVFAMLDVSKDRIIAVGDALATDIRGAANVSIDALWVLAGIHGEALGDDPALAQEEADGAGLAPVASVPAFVW